MSPFVTACLESAGEKGVAVSVGGLSTVELRSELHSHRAIPSVQVRVGVTLHPQRAQRLFRRRQRRYGTANHNGRPHHIAKALLLRSQATALPQLLRPVTVQLRQLRQAP
ncbi:hypothetical protein SKAU_G00328010 [Synaphobranchus kaupii]|uniref:Uncharacterized protein n=1 Tax=Synaphobranchus kaupii TaxID=118154 RepID=A0A9Q1EQ97_SYNKA|nr:hypothetical protein SKAU_G00328010 [Synaphobranchus kaupii]